MFYLQYFYLSLHAIILQETYITLFSVATQAAGLDGSVGCAADL